MLTVIYIVLGVLILLVVLAALGPKSYAVNRSIDIRRDRKDIFDYMKLIKEQDEWGPWAGRDPQMQKSWEGTDGEVGFVARWKGNKDVGEGEQHLVKLEPHSRIETHLRFIKPFKSESDVYYQLDEKTGGITRVTWGMTGQNATPVSRIFGLFMNMDKMIGKDFESGLSNLKEHLEKA